MDHQLLISLNETMQRLVESNNALVLELQRNRSEQPLKAALIKDVLSDLIDSVDVKSILKISDSTLYRIKGKNLIRTVRVGKRDYYSLAEVQTLRRYFLK